MSFVITKATREGVKPLGMLYAESGCGKTMSALLLARGIAGPNGKIVLADSESRRASLYADVIPGGFETFDLCEPFSPARYVEAVDTIEKAGAAVGIIDSGSHEWEGPTGVLDMAGENESRSGKAGLHNWRVPKLEHAKLVQRLLRTSIPFIICLRAKYKTKQGKDERGKTCIIKDDFISPIQDEAFLFEATYHAEILHDHSVRLSKASHPDLRKCFPEKGPITIEHGKLIAAWCAAPKGPGTGKEAVKTEIDPRGPLLKELRDLTTDIHGWTKELGAIGWGIAKPKMETWIRDELGQDTLLDVMTIEQLQETISAAKRRLKTLPGEKQTQLV